MPVDIMTLSRTYPGLVAVISTKADGNMRVVNDPERDAPAWKNRDAFLAQCGVTRSLLVRPELEHTGTVQVVGSKDAGTRIPHTDGLVTADPDVFLVVTVADCLPVFLYDPVHRAIGLLHAGWRGVEQEIIPHGIAAMQQHFFSDPAAIRMVIGPGIGVDHYDVPEERAARFSAYPGAVQQRAGKTFLDIKTVAQQQAERLGVAPDHITVDSTCTACAVDTYFSSRRERPAPLQTQMALFGMRKT